MVALAGEWATSPGSAGHRPLVGWLLDTGARSANRRQIPGEPGDERCCRAARTRVQDIERSHTTTTVRADTVDRFEEFTVGVPVQEQDQQQTHDIGTDELNALLYAQPALQLAGEDGDENEPHIWRGID